MDKCLGKLGQFQLYQSQFAIPTCKTWDELVNLLCLISSSVKWG